MHQQLDSALTTLREAAAAAAKLRVSAPLERKLTKTVRAAWKDEQRAVLKALRQVHEVFRESAADDAVGAALASTQPLLATAIQQVAEQAVLAGGRVLLASVGMDLAFNLDNPRARAFLQAYGAGRVTLIEDTTRAWLRQLLLDSFENGWGYDEVARRIVAQYSDWSKRRALLIAITEVGEAFEAGNRMAADDIATGGIAMEKLWLTVGDDRVSQGCRMNQGAGWIGLEDTFPSGHQHPLRFPGCRCTTLYRRKT